MPESSSSSQWDRLLLNLGDWQGSFTRLSPTGDLTEDIPTLVSLVGLEQNSTMRQTIQHFDPLTQAVVREKVLEYSSLNRSILFFEDGAFCQGSIQWAPFAEFGAEFGFIRGDRRMRLVQLFSSSGQLDSLTLIREQRQATQAPERPTLTVEALLGEWHGEAVTLYPDWRSPQVSHTQLRLQRQEDRLEQQLISDSFSFTSTAQIQGNLLKFDQGNSPMQVLLLPDGASSTTPLSLRGGQGFFLEAGWLIEDTVRQRVIRRYDDKGGWVSLTQVTERKVG